MTVCAIPATQSLNKAAGTGRSLGAEPWWWTPYPFRNAGEDLPLLCCGAGFILSEQGSMCAGKSAFAATGTR
jgi:hypothetical protein